MNSGLIVRLVDVVLIILFGFIGISDIKVKRQIKVPGKTVETETPQENQKNNVMVVVDFYEDDLYIFSVENKPIGDCRGLSKVRNQMLDYRDQYGNDSTGVVFILRPNETVSMQQTINVFDICEKEKLARSIDFNLTGTVSK
ncbi:MAG: biopolymer transporter ExbD [Deferribacteres bacterium]|nr:biopolymer transporter ExbD [candidate division KSB1 bacterium]MCB9500718.1 biopolymer transporter ExbD [Deferribacteres bacterium]